MSPSNLRVGAPVDAGGDLADAARMPAPFAARVRRPSWRDPRLAIGLVLVFGSMVAGGKLVAAAEGTEPFYVANHALAPGDPIGAGDVRVERAALTAGDLYLRADRAFPAGLVARQAVEAGQLMPVSAVGTDETVSTRAFPISVSGRLASSIRKGARVDLWAMASASPGSGAAGSAGATEDPTDREAAEKLVAGAVVAEVQSESGSFAGTDGPTVQVLLSQEQIPAVLAAQARKATLSVLPAAGG